MKTVVMTTLGILVWCSAAFAASDAAMVEKHIFLPEKPAEEKEVVSDDKLEKSILFTGVVVSDKGKFALITERAPKKPGEFRKKIYQEGETVSGAVISSISANHLVLTNAGNDVKIKLYRADKQRPKPVAVQPSVQVTSQAPAADASGDGAKKTSEKAQADTKAPQSPSQMLDNKIRQSEAAKGNVLDKKSNPFAEALKKAIQNKQAGSSGGGGSTGTTTNPFLEAIKRAQEKQ